MVAAVSVPAFDVVTEHTLIPSLALEDWHPNGVLNLYGGFWGQVRKDLHPEQQTARNVVARANTLAWLCNDDDETLGSYRWWCALMDIEPRSWRTCLIAGGLVAAIPFIRD